MKKFYEVYDIIEAKEDGAIIYCDMDQVLCNFIARAEEVLGVPFPKADKKEKWKTISGTKDFWANLDWMSGAQRLWSMIDKHDAHILSAYSSKDPNSQKGKLAWLKTNAKLTKRSRIHLVQRADKRKFAMINNKSNILVDDYKKNIDEWESAGGVGIHHTSVSRTISELKELGY
jgi:hypothetical protein|tara:strand:- start:318 stop:839 length:522 start_codon:yes stop_codon:yes gene_type:complete